MNETILISDDIHALVAAQYGHKLAQDLDFSVVAQTALVTAILEVGRNICKYAGTGSIMLEVIHENIRTGICVTAMDDGPGIPDVALAMQDGYSTGRSLGLGLPGARRLMDHFTITSAPGQGTNIVMYKWKTL